MDVLIKQAKEFFENDLESWKIKNYLLSIEVNNDNLLLKIGKLKLVNYVVKSEYVFISFLNIPNLRMEALGSQPELIDRKVSKIDAFVQLLDCFKKSHNSVKHGINTCETLGMI